MADALDDDPSTDPPAPATARAERPGTSAHGRRGTRRGDRRRRHRAPEGDGVDRRRRRRGRRSCARSAATSSGCARSTPRRSPSFNVREETGRYRCFGCDQSGRRLHVRPADPPRRLRRRRRVPRRQGRHAAHLHDAGQSAERQRRKRLVEAMSTAVEWYHERLLNDPTAGRRATTCAAAASTGDDRPAVQARLGARRLGRPGQAVRHRRRAAAHHRAWRSRTAAGRMQDAFRARVLFPIFSDSGEAVAIGGRSPARVHRSGEVQELAGDADLRQVEDALRAELGEGRHRQPRPGRRVRGLHRRDRLPPRRGAPCRRDVRHGVHRGARAADQALRQPGGAGVRRRHRRPGRRRAVLRVGAEVPGRRWPSPACPTARIPASWPSATRLRCAAAVADAAAVPGVPAAPGVDRQPGPDARGAGAPGASGR